MNIVHASAGDLAEIRALLDAERLPSADVDAGKVGGMRIARNENGVMIGVIGLESHAPAGLLRSLVVAPSQRGGGLGAALVAAIEGEAREGGIRDLFLLTTTAEEFFARLHYIRVPRESAPAVLQSTAEFAALCPATAVCMRKTP
jgi:amino-acid N-acetyltransferase